MRGEDEIRKHIKMHEERAQELIRVRDYVSALCEFVKAWELRWVLGEEEG